MLLCLSWGKLPTASSGMCFQHLFWVGPQLANLSDQGGRDSWNAAIWGGICTVQHKAGQVLGAAWSHWWTAASWLKSLASHHLGNSAELLTALTQLPPNQESVLPLCSRDVIFCIFRRLCLFALHHHCGHWKHCLFGPPPGKRGRSV